MGLRAMHTASGYVGLDEVLIGVLVAVFAGAHLCQRWRARALRRR